MADSAALEELLSRPTAAVVDAMAALDGDLVILGAGGKMGPSLARLARRASSDAGSGRRIVAVARFTNPHVKASLAESGVETITADLLDREQLAALPEAANVVFMAGQKFGTTGDEPRTWAINALLPGWVAERYRTSRIVSFSTGNVYPLHPTGGEGPTESDPTGPIGEYAQSALARERILEFFSRRHGTPMAVLRLNYAIEPRYGVLHDIGDRVRNGRAVGLAMARVNVIWQRDANAIALRAFAGCASPPLLLNVTGRPAHPVRWIAERFGARFGIAPRFEEAEAPTALLSDASRMESLFGRPEVGIEEMIEQVAAWMEQGGGSLGKPTHFEQREGKF